MKKISIEKFFQKEELQKAKKYLDEYPNKKQTLEKLFLEYHMSKSVDFNFDSTIKNLQNQVDELSGLYHQLKNYPTVQLDPQLLKSLDKANEMISETKSKSNSLRSASEVKYDIDRIIDDIRMEISR